MRRILITTVASFGALLGAFATPAFAQSPWWHLNSSARPTYLHSEPGFPPGRAEIQDVTVSGAVGGTFILAHVTPEEISNEEAYEKNSKGEHKYVKLEVGAEAKMIREGLETGGLYGPGNVEVTERGVPGMARLGLEPYEIKFKGELTDHPEELINTELNEPFRTGSTVTVTQVSAGRNAHADGLIVATMVNLGDAGTSGKTTIVDKLPEGLSAVGIEGVGGTIRSGMACSLEPQEVVCVDPQEVLPYQLEEIRISVSVGPHASSGEENEVSISGGGAPNARIRHKITISDGRTPFGVENYELTLEEEGGAIDTQAGSHPFQTTFTTYLNQESQGSSGSGFSSARPAGLAKDLHNRFPAGLIGNPKPFEQCTLREFLARHNECPAGSVVGVAVTTFGEPDYLGSTTTTDPVFNLEKPVGEPAQLGFTVLGNENPVYLGASVRTGENYGVEVHVNNITQKVEFATSYVTLWGVPGDSRHDSTRGFNCLKDSETGRYPEPCQPLGVRNPPPFVELPTSCTGPLQSSMEADSWEDPSVFTSFSAESEPALDGCNRLPFEPSLEVAPDGHAASTPTGLAIDQHISQEVSLNPKGLGESDVKGVTVTFPEGVFINPSGADGLEACSEALVGYLPGESTPPEDLHFTRTLPGSYGSSERFEPGVNFCPNASKIGTVRIKTPVLPNELEGAMYLASQNSNPFGSLVAMYIVAEDPTAGILVKLPGEISLNPQTGQITATFLNIPQAPFEEAEFHLFGGERAPLATPAHCGTYTTKVVFTPWSGNALVTTESPFEIDSGPNGTPCPGAQLPFNPSVTGGATNIQAGEFTPLTVSMSRKDGERNLKSIEAKLPPGLSGVLTGVELCPEPQANLGECGPNSLIGEATVSVGVGSLPFTVTGGRFYLTGPYNGTGGCAMGSPGCAPFGLTFEVPAKAGPYDLERNTANPAGEDACDCVVVRGKIELNPITSAITITSDPPGSPYAIPTSIEGIPLEIQHVNATTTRSNFQFNPTNCAKMALVGTVLLSEGGADTLTTPFQVTNCAALKFAPKLSVSTSAKTSRADGASLNVKLTYPSASFGSQANIKQVKVELPKGLPSRLSTLQKACTAAQFHANPAGCPAASIVGHAKAITPLIPVPLEGPAYFVSNGGEAFPNLIVVLQGYNVTIDLVGDTFISKAGVTSSTFKTVPDQPVGSFELNLPEGPYSALTTDGNLCTQKLVMPTEFIGQNGAEVHQNTKIAVTGCPKTVRHERKRKHHHKKRKRK